MTYQARKVTGTFEKRATGLIYFGKRFQEGFVNKGPYIAMGTYNQNNKKNFKTSYNSLDQNMFCILHWLLIKLQTIIIC